MSLRNDGMLPGQLGPFLSKGHHGLFCQVLAHRFWWVWVIQYESCWIQLRRILQPCLNQVQCVKLIWNQSFYSCSKTHLLNSLYSSKKESKIDSVYQTLSVQVPQQPQHECSDRRLVEVQCPSSLWKIQTKGGGALDCTRSSSHLKPTSP